MGIRGNYKNLLSDMQARQAPAPSVEGFQQSLDPDALLEQVKASASLQGQAKASAAAQQTQAPQEAPAPELAPAPVASAPSEVAQASDLPDPNYDPSVEEPSVQAPEQLLQNASQIGQAKAQEAQAAVTPQAPQGYASGMDDAALVKAQQEAGQNSKRALMMEAFFGDNQSFMKALNARSNAGVDNLQARRKGASEEESLKQSKAKSFGDADEMQQNDPASPVSHAAQEFAIKLGLNPDAVKKSSYANIQKLMTEKRLNDQFEESVKARLQSANLARDSKKEGADARSDEKTNKRFSELNNKLTSEIASSRSAFGKAANVHRSAEAIETLVAGIPNPNDIDSRQIAELARSLDSMLAQGAATVSGSAHLIPSTASKDLAHIQEYLMGIPKGTQQGEFVKRMTETVKREKELARKQIAATGKKITAGYSDLQKRDPERWNEVMSAQGIGGVEDQAQEESVNIQAPNGKVHMIPKSQADAAIKAGGKLVK
jgi:hypothetical protein